MKLSLCILQEWLKKYSPRLDTKRDCRSQRCSLDCLCIENAQLFTGQEDAWNRDRSTLFVGRHCDFFPGEKHDVVCRYTESALFLDTDDLFSVFNEILNAFRFYENWCNSLLHLIDQHCTLSELLDLSDSIIQNPMFVLDSDDYLIACSTKYENDDIDNSWDYMLKHGRSPEEIVFPFHDKDNHYFSQNYREPYLIEKGLFPRNTCSQNLFYNQEWCGICVMIEYTADFNTGKTHLFKILCNYIQLWVNKQTDDLLLNQDISLFVDLLQGKDCDSHRLQHKLQLNGWESRDTCILVYAGNISSEFYTQNYLCRIFFEMSPFIYAVSFDSAIVMICNISKYEKKHLLQSISPWLKRGAYHCGLSIPFTDLANIPAAYKQARTAFVYGEKKNRANNISESYGQQVPEEFHDIQNYMLYGTLDQLKEITDTSFIHPGVIRLLEYDKIHGSTYVQTLLAYLENERSIKDTALCLNIHRNTLLQRIQRLDNYFAIRMDTPDERLYLLLSLRLV